MLRVHADSSAVGQEGDAPRSQDPLTSLTSHIYKILKACYFIMLDIIKSNDTPRALHVQEVKMHNSNTIVLGSQQYPNQKKRQQNC